jgi:nucleoid DNA-binding protein
MTKSDLIDSVIERTGLPGLTKKSTGMVVDAVFESVKHALAADARFSMPGFGTFSVKTRQARTGRNPRTGASIEIPASKSIGFKAAPGLKDAL